MSHLQNIVNGLDKKEAHCNVKWQFMMANYEIVEFIAIMKRLIEILQFLLNAPRRCFKYKANR